MSLRSKLKSLGVPINALHRLLSQPITSQSTDGTWGQIFCFAISPIVLILGVRKLSVLQLTEAELFHGVLLVATLALLCTVTGLLLPLVMGRTQKTIARLTVIWTGVRSARR